MTKVKTYTLTLDAQEPHSDCGVRHRCGGRL